MKYKNWNDDTKNYTLTEGFEIKRANTEEFAIYSMTYRTENLTFRKSWEIHYEEVKNYSNCFWITKDDKRIGGVKMQPNYIDNLFMIPPYSDFGKLLQIIKKLLVHWSDKNNDIYSSGVTASEIEYYSRVGFFKQVSVRYMIRPTEKFNLDWEDNFIISCPEKENDLEISKLFHEAYSDGIDDYAKQSIDEHIPQVRGFLNQEFDMIIKSASALVYNTSANELIGVCFISLWDGWPYIDNLVVKPSYRGKGLAEKMIKRALSILKDEYPVIRLNVLVGNPSESLYHKLGFTACAEMSYLYMPKCYR